VPPRTSGSHGHGSGSANASGAHAAAHGPLALADLRHLAPSSSRAPHTHSDNAHGTCRTDHWPLYRPTAAQLECVFRQNSSATIKPTLEILKAAIKGQQLPATPTPAPARQSKRKRVQSALDPKARTNLHTRAEDVALVVYLYTFGWNFQHAKDSRHCKELLPYDRGALKFLQDLDMQRIPNELVAVLEEAAPKPLWNGCFVVEVRDHRSDHLDFEKSRALKSLMPDVRRIRLYPTPASLLGELQNLCYEHKPTGTQTWSEEEWVGLERRMLSRIQGPVCLDPSVLVFCIANVSNYNRIKYSPTLTKCRTVLKPRAAGDVVEEDERVPVLKKSVYSPLVSFLTRGKRVRQKAQPSH